MASIQNIQLARMALSGHHSALRGVSRRRQLGDEERNDMAWKLLVALAVMLILAGIGLSVYGGRLTPEQQRIEQVLPDERFSD